MKNILAKSEWKFLAIISAIVMVVIGAPYLYAALTAPAGTVFNGLNSLTPGDNPVYYSYINQASQGSLLVENLFTTEDQSAGLLNVFWLAVGLFAGLFGLTPPVAFHLFRVLLAPALIVVLYLFIAHYFSTEQKRKLTLLVLLFSAGLGAYVAAPVTLADVADAPGFFSPNDIWIPESITFLTLYKTSHFIASLGLMVGTLFSMLLAFEKKSWRFAVLAGVLALIHFNFHPFYVPISYGVPGLYLLYLTLKQKSIPWDQVGRYVLFVLIAAPSVLYHFWTLQGSEVVQGRAFQNVTLAPPFFMILVGYGFLWIGAVVGVYLLAKKKMLKDRWVFLVLWLGLSVFLMNIPFQFQSRYTQGLHVILVILSMVAWFWLKDVFSKTDRFPLVTKNPTLIVMLFLLFFAISNIFNLGRDLYYYTVKPETTQAYFYVPDGLSAAFDFLSEEPQGSIVMSDVDTALFVPGFTGHKTYVAHGIETLDYESKRALMSWVLIGGEIPGNKKAFLKEAGITHVLLPTSVVEENNIVLDDRDYLEKVLDNDDAVVYRVMVE